jgi:mannitol/fructose-specific phosphotransferase system IIA component (Ntr-type)
MHSAEPVLDTIRLATVFPQVAILMGLSNSKQQAIQQLTHHLAMLRLLRPLDEQSVTEQILKRENTGTTALGNGIALPNCLSAHTTTFLGAIGISSEGINFDAIDGEPVRSVFLLVGPPENREQHFELLGRIAAIGRDKTLRLQLQGCRTAEGIHHFLEELDRNAAHVRVNKGRRLL